MTNEHTLSLIEQYVLQSGFTPPTDTTVADPHIVELIQIWDSMQKSSEIRLLDPEMPAQEMRLCMGEMTTQEMRTARAAIQWANSYATFPRRPTEPVSGCPITPQSLALHQNLFDMGVEHAKSSEQPKAV